MSESILQGHTGKLKDKAGIRHKILISNCMLGILIHYQFLKLLH